MLKSLKTILLFSCCLLFICSVTFAQTDSTHLIRLDADSYYDDEFNIFLFSLLMLFMCGLFGAAFICALATGLIVLLLLFITAFGFVSTATAIGIYKRSFTAGFASFLMLIFCVGCSIIGCIGLTLADYFFHLPTSRGTALVVGLVSGALGGIVLGKVSAKTIQLLFSNILKKIKSIAS
jgi:hypothetical protein